MSVPQMGPPRRGSPAITNSRGVNYPVQQHSPSRPLNGNQSNQQWRGAAVSTSTNGFRPASPANPEFQSPRSSNQHLPKDRKRAGSNHARSHSAILPSSSGNMVGSLQRPQVPMIAVSGPQARPASLHTTAPSAMDPGLNGMYIQQKSPRQPMQPAVQGSEWLPGVIPNQNFQQSQAQFKALEREFQNFVMSSSPSHSRNGSLDSAISNRSSYSRPSSAASQASSAPADAKDAVVHATRRNYTSSPLAKPARPSVDTTTSSNNTSYSNGLSTTASPSRRKPVRVEGKSSRLRRVLSAGSLDDLSKSTDNKIDSHAGNSPKWEGGNTEQKQEGLRPDVAGNGNGIYGSNFFSRSLDSIAMSSTASSASAMFRKMGNGMKKGSRSLSGLFRPKAANVTGSPTTLVQEVSQPTVSMVTAEAETQQAKGPLPPKISEAFPVIGLGSPGGSLNSEPPQLPQWPKGETLNAPKNIVKVKVQDLGTTHGAGTVPKSILKSSPSPVSYPESGKDAPTLPEIISSPSPSVPSTPTNENQDSRIANPFLTTDLTADLEGLMDALNRVHDIDEPTEFISAVPKSSKHHTTFSSRLVFHDTWTPEEYDRRGEIATCNLLTPKLAQQIKDEINTFKMEMDVHEMSKMYTQFH